MTIPVMRPWLGPEEAAAAAAAVTSGWVSQGPRVAEFEEAFAAAVGGLLRGGRLRDPHCVAKTFPDFWGAWHALLEP